MVLVCIYKDDSYHDISQVPSFCSCELFCVSCENTMSSQKSEGYICCCCFRESTNHWPKVTFEGDYSAGIERLATLLVNHYGSDLFPVVPVGDDLLDPFWGEFFTSCGKTSERPQQNVGRKKHMFLD